jgi:carbonic anhydrase/acetyltransferase-like protein (isoleucine patch superfamily)
MALYELDGIKPQIAAGVWIADSAQVMGDVVLGENANIWFGAVLRGDTDTITVGKNSNVQDGSVLHADENVPLTIGDNVTVGHQVMLHGCTIGDGCIVGAGSVVTEGKEFPDYSLIVGSPAKVVRQLDEATAQKLLMSAQHYVKNAQRFAKGLKQIA